MRVLQGNEACIMSFWKKNPDNYSSLWYFREIILKAKYT